MKTKHYEFTETEMIVIQEALIEYWQNTMKKSPACSPIVKEMKASCLALKEQFKADVVRI